MSLTGPQNVFAGVNESGINKFLVALFQARRHLLTYGSPHFVPTTTAAATSIPAITFPGAAPIEYKVEIAPPPNDRVTVDIFPGGPNPPLPPNPPLVAGQWSMHTNVALTIGCRDNNQGMTPLTTTLDVWLRGTVLSHFTGPGQGDIQFQVSTVKLDGVMPPPLAAFLECLLRMMIQAALSNVRLPFQALTAGAFRLILQRGPLLEDNQVEVFGAV